MAEVDPHIIHDVPTRVDVTAAPGQRVFTFPFRLFDRAYLYVAIDGVYAVYDPFGTTLLTYALTTDYTTEGGTVTLGAPCVGGEHIAIARSIAIERITAFPNTGPVPMRDINAEFDRHIAIMQELERDQDTLDTDVDNRVLKAGDTMSGPLNTPAVLPTVPGTSTLGTALAPWGAIYGSVFSGKAGDADHADAADYATEAGHAGNADTAGYADHAGDAGRLATARVITAQGDLAGVTAFDGSSNVDFALTLVEPRVKVTDTVETGTGVAEAHKWPRLNALGQIDGTLLPPAGPIDLSAYVQKAELALNTGAAMVGTAGGTTLQAKLNSLDFTLGSHATSISDNASAIAANTAAIAANVTAINGKVAKAGDTMTGPLVTTRVTVTANTNARVIFNDTSQVADRKIWDINANNGTLYFGARNDADSTGGAFMACVRGTGANAAQPEYIDFYTRATAAFTIDNAQQALVRGAALIVRNSALVQHDGSHMYVRPTNGTGELYLGAYNANQLRLNTAAFSPVNDNTLAHGWSDKRFTTIYAVTGAINTSDAREKTQLRPLDRAELRAGRAIAKIVGIYQWLQQVEDKGEDGARLHCGIIAQQVVAAMEAEGLDAFGYGFCCHDSWREEKREEPVMDYVEVPALLDEDGREVRPPALELQQVGTREIVVPAGDRYGVRYDELAMFLIASQEQRLAALEAQLEDQDGRHPSRR